MKQKNIGIITSSKKLEYFSSLNNNTYLLYYLPKKSISKKYIISIIDYMQLNDCTHFFINIPNFIVDEDMQKKYIIINTLDEIESTNKTKKIILYNLKSNNNEIISFEKATQLRKDCNPNYTISKIKKILKDNNYIVKETGKRKSLKGVYSIRLELNNKKGSNGKGLSLKLAKASAYAELIERLQSNMLNKARISTSKIQKNNKIFKILLSEQSEKYKKEFFNLDNIYFNVDKALNIKNNKYEYIPVNAICSFCHTNGLASGNSFNEAVSQAIFEILERYCYQECLKGKVNIKNIDISQYPLTKKNKKLIKLLHKKGFKIFIKDCSLGKYPVLGLLLFNNDMSKYTFTMGADYSFNIALSRCITEMMQGVNFEELKVKMVNNLTLEDLEKKYKKNFKSYNWLRCFNNNNGYLSKNFFNNDFCNIKELNFKDYLLNNDDIIYNLKENIKEDIYVMDYNKLGFDTYRVYIPHMTTVDGYDFDDLFVNINYNRLKNTYIDILNSKEEDLMFFVNTFIEINKNIKYEYMIKPSDIFHVDEISNYYKLDFTNLLIILALITKKKKDLINLLNYKIKYFNLTSQKKEFYKSFVNCLSNKVKYDIKTPYYIEEIKQIINEPSKYLHNLNPQKNKKSNILQNKKA